MHRVVAIIGLIALLAAVMPTTAQPAYLKGYVIYDSGDTAIAYIHFNPAVPPTDAVEIRSAPYSKDQVIPSNKAKAFWVPNYGKFIVRTVPISYPRVIYGTSRYWNEVSSITGFLQELLIGHTYSLYKLGNIRYYLRKNGVIEDDGFEELILRDFDDCCRYDVYQDQLIAFLPLGDTYEKVIRYAGYNDQALKAAVGHLNHTGEVEKVSHNHVIHFYASAGVSYNKLNMVSEVNVPFSSGVGPSIEAGIFWQSSGAFERFLNILSISYSQYTAGYRGWLHDQFALPSNTHTVYNISPNLAILYRIREKFNYRIYAGISAGVNKTILQSKLTSAPINSDYFTARCFNGDALVFKAECMVDFGRYSVKAFQQIGGAYDLGANGYQLNPRSNGLQFGINF